MIEAKPFKIAIGQPTIARINRRVRDFEWHEMPRGAGLDGTWAYGANLDYMKRLAEYWIGDYDWRKQEEALNRFPQFIANVDGLDIHFIREEGSGPSPTAADPQPRLAGIGVRIPAHHRKTRPPRTFRRRCEGCFHGDRAVAARLWLLRQTGTPHRPAQHRRVISTH